MRVLTHQKQTLARCWTNSIRSLKELFNHEDELKTWTYFKHLQYERLLGTLHERKWIMRCTHSYIVCLHTMCTDIKHKIKPSKLPRVPEITLRKLASTDSCWRWHKAICPLPEFSLWSHISLPSPREPQLDQLHDDTYRQRDKDVQHTSLTASVCWQGVFY